MAIFIRKCITLREMRSVKCRFLSDVCYHMDIKHNRKIYQLLKQDCIHTRARTDYSALIRDLLCTLVLVMIYLAVQLGIAV